MSATIDEWFQFPSRMKLYGLMDRTKYIHDKHTAHIRGLKIKKKKKEQGETGEISQKQELKLRPTSPLLKNVKKYFSLCCRDRSIWGVWWAASLFDPNMRRCVNKNICTYIHIHNGLRE